MHRSGDVPAQRVVSGTAIRVGDPALRHSYNFVDTAHRAEFRAVWGQSTVFAYDNRPEGVSE